MNRPDDGIDEFVKIGRFTFQIGDTDDNGATSQGVLFSRLSTRARHNSHGNASGNVGKCFPDKPQGLDKFGHDPTKELQ